MKTLLIFIVALGAFMVFVVGNAGAAMQVGLEADDQCVEHYSGTPTGARPLLLARMRQAHARWLHVQLDGRWWASRRANITACVRDAHAAGLHVDVTLRAETRDERVRHIWNPAEARALAASAVPALAPYVDAWSPFNEPNLLAPPEGRIVPAKAAVRRLRYVRARHGRYVRRRGRYVHAKARSHGRRYARRRVVVSPARAAHKVYSWTSLGVSYRSVWNAVMPIVARYDPTAQRVMGDVVGAIVVESWLDGVFAGPLAVRPTVLGAHMYLGKRRDAYSGALSIGRQYVAMARRHGIRHVWNTEAGLRSTSAACGCVVNAWPVARRGDLTAMLNGQRAAGVEVSMLFEVFAHASGTLRWDTALINANGTPRPQWAELTSWR